MQFIVPARHVTLPITDLRELEPAERAQQEHRLISEEAWTPFDLLLGPLLRVRLIRTGQSERVLVSKSPTPNHRRRLVGGGLRAGADHGL